MYPFSIVVSNSFLLHNHYQYFHKTFSKLDRCQTKFREIITRDHGPEGQNFQLGPDEFCAGGEAGKDACEGDGGSPLVCQSESGRWTVVGLVSYGVGCGEAGVPGAYVDIYHHLKFIDEAGQLDV